MGRGKAKDAKSMKKQYKAKPKVTAFSETTSAKKKSNERKHRKGRRSEGFSRKNHMDDAGHGKIYRRPRTLNNNNNNNNFKTKKTARPTRVRLPKPKEPCFCPWMDKKHRNSEESSLSESLLDTELKLFSKYVQLTDTELQARNHLVRNLQRLAKALFSKPDQAYHEEEVVMQTFGSFATPAVCVFCSDVDLALWGAVPSLSGPELRRKTTKPRAPPPPKLLKVAKWTAALEDMDEENGVAPDETPVKQSSVKLPKSPEEEDSELPLFLIDRQGLGEDYDFEETGNAEMKEEIKLKQDCCRNFKVIDLTNSAEDSDEDSADKMEAFQKAPAAKGTSTTHPISLTSSASGDSASDKEEDNMQVSIFADAPGIRKTTGPTGRIRDKVVDALCMFRRRLRKCPLTDKVTLIKARVPILKLQSKMGVEIDVAVGGHNGTDTSHFAAMQDEKFESFSAVVLFLKILLHQHDLDVPFTGGLGSYKLYVLVAYHIQKHLALGGSDNPGEVLLGFLFRYSGGAKRGTQTVLYRDKPLKYSADCSADLSNVYRLDSCVELFRACYECLQSRSVEQQSVLKYVIDVNELTRLRSDFFRKAAAAVKRWGSSSSHAQVKMNQSARLPPDIPPTDETFQQRPPRAVKRIRVK